MFAKDIVSLHFETMTITNCQMEKTNVIQQHLKEVEQEHEVKVLLAVESGSRAWGIESENSDWDVRLVYMHRPQWYLSVERKRDVIECMYEDKIDLVGWDLKKALGLLRSSNPSLLEWLHSPIVYMKDSDFMKAMEGVADRFFNPSKMMYHYHRIYFTHNTRYLQRENCRLKVFFYYLRGILGCRWIEQHQTLPPIPFKDLVEGTVPEAEMRAKIDELVILKKSGSEKDTSVIDTELLKYTQHWAEYYTSLVKENRTEKIPPSTETLDAILYQMVMNFK